MKACGMRTLNWRRLKLTYDFESCFLYSISSATKSIRSCSSFSTSIIPTANGSYLHHTFEKASRQSSPTLIFYSVADAAKPSRIMAMKRLRKTRLTMRMKAMK